MDLGTRGPTPKENPVLIKCVPTRVSMAPLLAVKAQTGHLGQEHPVPAALLPLGGGGWAVWTSSVAPVLHQQARLGLGCRCWRQCWISPQKCDLHAAGLVGPRSEGSDRLEEPGVFPMPQFLHLSTWWQWVVRRDRLRALRPGVTAPLRAWLPYLLAEVPWQMIPQALLSSKQLQTWMG